MTISVIQTFSETTATAGATSMAVTATGTTAGNTLAVFAAIGSGAASTGITGGTNGAYSNAGSIADALNSNYIIYAGYKTNIAGGSDVITVGFNFSSPQYSLFAVELGGAGLSGFDGFIGAVQATPPTTTDGITTGSGAGSTNAHQPALIVGLCKSNQANVAVGTSFTSLLNVAGNASIGGVFVLESRRITTTGAQAATWTGNQSANTMSIMMIFDELVAGTGSIGLYESLNGGFSGLNGGFRS